MQLNYWLLIGLGWVGGVGVELFMQMMRVVGSGLARGWRLSGERDLKGMGWEGEGCLLVIPLIYLRFNVSGVVPRHYHCRFSFLLPKWFFFLDR